MRIAIRGLVAFALLGCASSAVAQSFPSAKDVVALGQKSAFVKDEVGDQPVVAEVAAINPKFRMLVYFASEDPIQLSKERTGAVTAKLNFEGVPEDAGLPDGTYYVWIGVVEGKLQSLLVREDGSTAQELFMLDEPLSL